MEHILLETMLRHAENKEVTNDSKCSLTKGRSRLTNLLVFCNEVTVLVDKEGAVTRKLNLVKSSMK